MTRAKINLLLLLLSSLLSFDINNTHYYDRHITELSSFVLFASNMYFAIENNGTRSLACGLSGAQKYALKVSLGNEIDRINNKR